MAGRPPAWLDPPARAGLESDEGTSRALPAHSLDPEAVIATETTILSDVRYLKGVGPKFAELFAKAGVETMEDLLYYVPRTYTDWSNIANVGSLKVGDRVTVVVRVVSCDILRRGRKQIFVAAIEDDTGAVVARWFGQPYLKNVLADDLRDTLHTFMQEDNQAEQQAPERAAVQRTPCHELATRQGPAHGRMLSRCAHRDAGRLCK